MIKLSDLLTEGSKKRQSAGIVVYHGSGADLKFLLLKADYWGMPKGRVEPGESTLSTAKRETHEETGIKINKVDPKFKETISYMIFDEWGDDRKLIILPGPAKKFVTFFLGEALNSNVRLSNEHTAYMWAGYKDAYTALPYRDDRKVLKKAYLHLMGAKNA